MAKRVVRIVVPLVVLAAAGSGGWWWWTELRFRESTDNAYVRAELASVSPQVSGHVAVVAVQDNQPVRAGDVLVEIEAREFHARLAQAEADLAAKRAELLSIAADRMVQQAKIAEGEAILAGARSEEGRARRDLDRYRALTERDTSSRQRWDIVQSDAERATAAVAGAGAALEQARRQLDANDARRRTAEAAIAMAQAASDLARIDLDRTAVRAPIAGVVGHKSVQVGDYVRPGGVVLRIVPIEAVYVEANFKETQLAGMAVGGRVTLEVDAFTGQKVTGTIVSLAPASGSTFSLLPAENATGNFTKIVQRVPVRIALPADNPLNGMLRPGLSVHVTADRRDMPEEGSLAIDGALVQPARLAHR